MQQRQLNKTQYFNELAVTSEKYFLPYIETVKSVKGGMSVLEIGCGEGGILLPFAKRGCQVTGLDLSEEKIACAKRIFSERGLNGDFTSMDFFQYDGHKGQFDLIICHDVFEHIEQKEAFITKIEHLLNPSEGVVFMAFPAWYMPFGGHQQICKSKFLSHLPFFHLLPRFLYRGLLHLFREEKNCISELLYIKGTRVTIEKFGRIVKKSSLILLNRQLYFINPHYEVKFHLRPRKLNRIIGKIPYVRDFFSTSCFYLLSLR